MALELPFLRPRKPRKGSSERSLKERLQEHGVIVKDVKEDERLHKVLDHLERKEKRLGGILWQFRKDPNEMLRSVEKLTEFLIESGFYRPHRIPQDHEMIKMLKERFDNVEKIIDKLEIALNKVALEKNLDEIHIDAGALFEEIYYRGGKVQNPKELIERALLRKEETTLKNALKELGAEHLMNHFREYHDERVYLFRNREGRIVLPKEIKDMLEKRALSDEERNEILSVLTSDHNRRVMKIERE